MSQAYQSGPFQVSARLKSGASPLNLILYKAAELHIQHASESKDQGRVRQDLQILHHSGLMSGLNNIMSRAVQLDHTGSRACHTACNNATSVLWITTTMIMTVCFAATGSQAVLT